VFVHSSVNTTTSSARTRSRASLGTSPTSRKRKDKPEGECRVSARLNIAGQRWDTTIIVSKPTTDFDLISAAESSPTTSATNPHIDERQDAHLLAEGHIATSNEEPQATQAATNTASAETATSTERSSTSSTNNASSTKADPSSTKADAASTQSDTALINVDTASKNADATTINADAASHTTVFNRGDTGGHLEGAFEMGKKDRGLDLDWEMEDFSHDLDDINNEKALDGVSCDAHAGMDSFSH
jgi:hypothetical protein